MDVTIHNALLDRTRKQVNIGIRDGKIVRISTDGIEPGKQSFDAGGQFVVPPFFESHFHLDNTLLWNGGAINSLQEAIRAYAEAKEVIDTADILKRATETLLASLSYGVLYFRSHVDIEPQSRLRLLEGVVAAKKAFAGIVDVEVIAFPQHGMARDPETVELMYAAMENGADLVGGTPHFEKDLDDAARQIETAFKIAKQYDVDIDMHVDETDDPYWKLSERGAEKTIEENYQGRVNASHCTSMAAWDQKSFDRIIPKVRDAGITITTNVLTNLIGHGLEDEPPVRRGIARLADLIEAGVNVVSATDDMKNMFYPFGNMNPLQAVNIAAHAGYLTSQKLIRAAFEMPLYSAAKLFRIDSYGIAEGNTANLVVLPVTSEVDAIRFQSEPLLVMREGYILVQSEMRKTYGPQVQKFLRNDWK